MLHHCVSHDTSGDHWGVSSSTYPLPGRDSVVLVQLQHNNEQVRLSMNASQAEEMAAALLEHARKVREAKPLRINLSHSEFAELPEDGKTAYLSALLYQSQSDKT